MTHTLTEMYGFRFSNQITRNVFCFPYFFPAPFFLGLWLHAKSIVNHSIDDGGMKKTQEHRALPSFVHHTVQKCFVFVAISYDCQLRGPTKDGPLVASALFWRGVCILVQNCCI